MTSNKDLFKPSIFGDSSYASGSVQPVQSDFFTDGTSEIPARADHQHPIAAGLLATISGGSGRRNLLDNGEFNVCQRYGTGSGVFLAPPVGTTNYADRWTLDWSNPGFGTIFPSYVGYLANNEFWTQLILQSGPAFVPVAGAVSRLHQTMEGIDVQHLRWGTSQAQPLVFSFYALSELNRTVIVEFENFGATSRQISRSIDLVAGSLQRYQVTIPGDTIQAPTADTVGRLRVAIWFCAGSTFSGGTSLNQSWGVATSNQRAFGCSNFFSTNTGQLQFTGCQLEIGTTATPFEHRDYRDTFEKCRRYLQVWTQPPLRGMIAQAANSVADRMGMVLPVPMSRIPTASLSGALPIYDGVNVGTANGISNNWSTTQVAELNFSTTIAARAGANTFPLAVYQNGTNSLWLNAEL